MVVAAMTCVEKVDAYTGGIMLDVLLDKGVDELPLPTAPGPFKATVARSVLETCNRSRLQANCQTSKLQVMGSA